MNAISDWSVLFFSCSLIRPGIINEIIVKLTVVACLINSGSLNVLLKDNRKYMQASFRQANFAIPGS